MSAGQIKIGISGWTYAPWRGTFFPKDLPQKQELAYASRQVPSIEINGTFYSLQRPSSYRSWHEQTPDDFIFSVKGPRFITHIKRLKDVELPLANFLASGVLRLNEKLGPILWQLPPSFVYDREKLADFFQLLPRDTKSAAARARHHDEHLKFGSWTKIDRNRPLRHALEVRHDSFMNPEFIALLRQHDIALVVADTAGKWPLLHDLTSDFVYVRLHGDEELYVSGYTPAALRQWAARIRAWSAGQNAPGAQLHAPPAKLRAGGRDVFVYFDNDVKIRAPYDAMSLAHLLQLAPPPPAPPPIESISEVPRAGSRWPGFGRHTLRSTTARRLKKRVPDHQSPTAASTAR